MKIDIAAGIDLIIAGGYIAFSAKPENEYASAAGKAMRHLLRCRSLIGVKTLPFFSGKAIKESEMGKEI